MASGDFDEHAADNLSTDQLSIQGTFRSQLSLFIEVVARQILVHLVAEPRPLTKRRRKCAPPLRFSVAARAQNYDNRAISYTQGISVVLVSRYAVEVNDLVVNPSELALGRRAPTIRFDYRSALPRSGFWRKKCRAF